MQTRYRVRVPIRAILDQPDGKYLSVNLPAGAILVRPSQPAEKGTTLFGMVGVYWEGRHYSVYPNDLLVKAERVESA
jgi:hypothetical protein